ncbi:MAG: restriction endonuclease subunit S [Parvularcula sp.]|jgi:type I restriction enzyme S subunit|nr:restriction endonuclease subunit S [Parvularcula sp.]
MSWPTSELQDFCEIKGGGRLKLSGNDFVDDGFPAYGAGGMNGLLPVAEFDRDAVVLSAIGARCGKCFLAQGEWTSLANTQVIFPDPNKADVRFLWYQLNDEARWPRSGVAQPFIKPAHVKTHKVILPPLEEQKRIAAILDQADALRRLRARALDKLNTLGQAIFHEMFGNPLNAGDVSLSDVLVASGNGLQVDQDESGEGLPVTRIETIWNGKIDPHRVKWSSPEMARAERFLLRPGDILFSHINSPEHIAKTAIYEGHPDRLLHGINLLRLQPDREKVSPYWLVTFLKSDPVRKFFRSRCKKAVNQASLNQKNLSELNFELPDYDAQVIFSEKFTGISAQIPVHVSSSERFDALFAAAQYRAFRGEL